MENFLFAGISSLCSNLLQPFLTIKNMKQTGISLSNLNLKTSRLIKVLYRGYWGTCLVDMSAYSIHNFCNYEFIGTSPLVRSILAGFLATPLITIGEFLIINKQLKGQSYRNISHSFELRTYSATLGRELPFPVFLFYVTPLIKNFMNDMYGMNGMNGMNGKDCTDDTKGTNSTNFRNSKFSEFLSGYLSGCFCGFLTNPFDRYKTIRQAGINSGLYQGMNLKRSGFKTSLRLYFIGSLHRANYIGLTLAITNLINSYRIV